MLTLLLAIQAASAQPPTLWQDVRAGMTLAELQTVRPAARPIPAAEKQNWSNGCEIADGKDIIGGVALDVCYEMQGGTISAVILHAPLKDHAGAAERFKPALVKMYGTPLMDSCGGFDRMTAHQTCNTVWKRGAVTMKNDRIKVANRNMITLEVRANADER